MIDFRRFIVPTGNSETISCSPPGSREPAKQLRLPRPKRGEKFFALNMPWSWFAVAAHLPGKALAVGMIMWWLVVVRKKRVVVFSYKRARCIGQSDESIRQSIRQLESAGLIEVHRAPGRSPRVSILAAPKTENLTDAEEE